MRAFKLLLASFALSFTCLAVAVPTVASAVTPDDVLSGSCQDPVAQKSSACKTDNTDTITGKNGIIERISGVVALVTGIVAVLMIIVGGFMYVTAGGDSSKAGNARKTIIYAIVGLLVVVFARAIIVLVINRV